MDVLTLINDGAGSVAKTGEVKELVRQGLLERGVKADVRMVPGREIGKIAKSFVSDFPPRSVVLVGGGDGTISAAASALAGTDKVLGVLPLGTLNHFAKDLGLPRELGAAMDVIAAGNATMIDVGEVNGRVFLNNSSIGVYPFFVAERTTEQRRSGASKLAAIGPALARTFKAASWQSVQIAAEGTREELRTPCVFVGNNFYDAADFGRRKSLSSGDLCIYLVRKQSWLGLMVLPLKIALGLVDTARDVELIQAKTLEIASRHRDVIVSLDGEAVEMTMPLRFRIRPGVLRVLSSAEQDANQVGQRAKAIK